MRRLDELVIGVDKVLRVVAGVASAARPNPGGKLPGSGLSEKERRHCSGLMRVNHVGEVCAQALYDSQGRFARTESLKRQFAEAAQEEADHLAWTAERLEELGARPSLLNPLWYAGAFGIGMVAAQLGDRYSLGFVVETERQVEAHLASHLDILPAKDEKSRAIVEQMRVDEVAHGDAARRLGAAELPAPARALMRVAAKVMTTTAYYI